MRCATSCCAKFPLGRTAAFRFDALVQRYNGDLANGYGNLVSRVVNMVHKYFGGVVPEAGAETAAEAHCARVRSGPSPHLGRRLTN